VVTLEATVEEGDPRSGLKNVMFSVHNPSISKVSLSGVARRCPGTVVEGKLELVFRGIDSFIGEPFSGDRCRNKLLNAGTNFPSTCCLTCEVH
jgi:hypothetical protein